MTDDSDASVSHSPKLHSDAFDCPRCGAYAQQTWLPLTKIGLSRNFSDDSSGGSTWRTAECARCDESSVWRGDRMIYPALGTVAVPHPLMPPEAKALYEEAREVLGISRRAGTALARASLERLLRTLDPEAGNIVLAERIKRVLDTVPAHLGQMLTIIRVAGNGSLHVNDEPDDVMILVLDPGETEIVELIFEAINELVDEKISKPQRVAEFYSKVPESIRERVERDKLG